MLAEHGFNILLVSRNKEKLENVKKTIQTRSKSVQIDYVVSNATDLSDVNINSVSEKIASRDVSILVNNVGIGQGGHVKVHELEIDNIKEAVNVNCIYPTLLTKSLMPHLLRHSGPKLVINVASVAALIIGPLSSVYGGTKAYNRQFSRAMSAEYYGDGVDVLCVSPGLVESNLTKMKPSLICCTARECAEQSLRKIGEIETIPHWKHLLMMSVTLILYLIPKQWVPPTVYWAVYKARTAAGSIPKQE